jgi:hypothetical protein
MLYNSLVKDPRFQFTQAGWFPAVVMFVLAFILVVVVFNPFSQKTSLLPISLANPTSTPMPTPPGGYPKEDNPLKQKLRNSIGGDWSIGPYDISPKATAVAFFAYKQPSTLGLYSYSLITGQSTSLATHPHSLPKSLGTYVDNYEVRYSPDGAYVFFNQTVYTAPQLYVFTSAGKVVHLGETDLGHPVWLNRYQLLYVSSTIGDKVAILDLYYNRISPSDFSSNLAHLSLDAGLRYVSAMQINYSGPTAKCGGFNLVVYDLATSKMIKKIPSVYVFSPHWYDISNLIYQTVVSCPSTYSQPTTVKFED